VLNADFEPDDTEEERALEIARRSQFVSLLEQIFVFVPEDRITPEAALQHEFFQIDFMEE
jgi:hypothetical protein